MEVLRALVDNSCSDWRKAESHLVWNCISLMPEAMESFQVFIGHLFVVVSRSICLDYTHF